ncbi:MAG: type II secretion system protein [Candidatus Saccharimonadales bacterium]
MSFNNIKSRLQDERGFTIVELLIVIVVIGILAAITIVSYTGISAKANTNTAKANAQSVVQVVETYAQDNNGLYPTLAQLNGITTGTAKLPSGLTVQSGILAATGFATPSPVTTSVQYIPKSTTGACVAYWDSVTGAPVNTLIGNALTYSNTTPSCT